MSILKVKENGQWLDIPALKGKDAKINGQNTIEIIAGDNITINQENNVLTISSTGSGSGTTSYDNLTNKPKINGVELKSGKTFEDLNLSSISNSTLDEIFDL